MDRLKGCLLIHGFTGSPEDMSPLAEHLRRNTDWVIYAPTLAGHGEDESLRRVTWQDWISSAEQELENMVQLCDEVYVIGFSMGGMIAAYLASKYPIEKLILLSTSVYYMNSKLLMKEFSDMVKDYFHDQYSLVNSMKKYKEKMTTTPLKAVMNFRKLVKEIRPIFQNISVPVLIIQGEQDRLVEPTSAHYIYDQVQSDAKEILLLKESRHVVCHDTEKDILFNKVDDFLQSSYLQ